MSLTGSRQSVTYSFVSSDKKVATVNSKGKVTGVSNGTATITCTAKNKAGETVATGKCTVQVVIPIKRIDIQTIQAVPLGREVTLEPVFTPSNATHKTIEWTSGNPDVATVSEDGVVKGMREGTTLITGKATDGSGKKVYVTMKVDRYDAVLEEPILWSQRMRKYIAAIYSKNKPSAVYCYAGGYTLHAEPRRAGESVLVVHYAKGTSLVKIFVYPSALTPIQEGGADELAQLLQVPYVNQELQFERYKFVADEEHPVTKAWVTSTDNDCGHQTRFIHLPGENTVLIVYDTHEGQCYCNPDLGSVGRCAMYDSFDLSASTLYGANTGVEWETVSSLEGVNHECFRCRKGKEN